MVSNAMDLICIPRTGARPTNDISIEFEIRPKFSVLWFKICSTDHKEILYTSRQLHRREVCEISFCSVKHVLNQNTPNVYRISNSIEIPLVGPAPGLRIGSLVISLIVLHSTRMHIWHRLTHTLRMARIYVMKLCQHWLRSNMNRCTTISPQ